MLVIVKYVTEVVMARKRLELTEGEWAIMLALWENEPCAAPTIQEVRGALLVNGRNAVPLVLRLGKLDASHSCVRRTVVWS